MSALLSESVDRPQRPQPTRVRHLVVISCGVMSVLLYLDRFCVSMAEPYIKQSLNLSSFQMGFFFSAFFLTYALFQVPSGWLSDRYGARIMLTIYVLAWSLFTGMIGLAAGFGMLILMRAACGLGQAGAYPTSAIVISKWVPFSQRGFASGIVAFGGRLGGTIAPALTALLIVMFVPVKQSSLFESGDILDAAALCTKLAPASEPSATMPSDPTPSDPSESADKPAAATRLPAVERAWSSLPTETQERVTAIAEEYRPLAERRKALEVEGHELQGRWQYVAAAEKFKEAEALTFEVDETDRQRLVEGLNGVVRDSGLHAKREDEPSIFDSLKNLDHAAVDYVARLERGETLSPAESERLNRFTLEGCFPDEIGRIYVNGWRPVMWIYGLVGLFVAALVWVAVRNRPEEHPRSNEAEHELIAAGRPAGAPGPHGKPGNVPWGRLLKSYSMWCNCLSQVGTNIGWLFLVTWFPRYLLEEHSVPILERGMMASTPLFVGWLGMLGGGKLTDSLVARFGLKWGRRLPWSLSRFLAMAAFLACPLLETPWAVTGAMSVVAFATDLGTTSAWAYCQDVGGRYVGSILGWGNMWGNLGATVSPILLAWVFETQGWNEMFMVCAAAFLASGMLAFGIDATVPIAPPDEEHDDDRV